jgi:uncharacterized RDD family membrane protein YckC
MAIARSTTYNAHETSEMHALHGRELASFVRRAAAFVFDLALGAVLLFLLMLSLVFVSGRGRPQIGFTIERGHASEHGAPTVQEPGPNRIVHVAFFNNVYSVVWWVLYFGLATYVGNGRTPGKRLLRIRVMSLVHERMSLWHSFERALGYGASLLEFGFGFAQYFIHPNRRTVHDRIAETIVVFERTLAPSS